MSTKYRARIGFTFGNVTYRRGDTVPLWIAIQLVQFGKEYVEEIGP